MLSDELSKLFLPRAFITQPGQRLINVVMENSGPQVLRADYLRIYLRNLRKQRLVGNQRQAKIPVFGSLTFKLTDLDEPLNGQFIGLLQMAKVKQFPDKGQPLGLDLETQDMDA
jgi:hypothetical protein